jgi:hypothetical protein
LLRGLAQTLRVNAVVLSLQQIAKALNGEVSGNSVRAPGPGHSAEDRSLSVTLSGKVDGGFIVKTFSPADDWQTCKDYVFEKLGLPKFQPQPNNNQFSLDVMVRAAMSAANSHKPKAKPVAISHYTDRDGTLIYDVLRFDNPKRFAHRLADGKFKGSERRVIYRWPELIKFPDATVFICEGEKDADNVASLDLCATTAASGKWTDDCVNALTGRICWILEDNDETGRKKALEAAQKLHPVAASVKIVRFPSLPDGGDVSDWLDMGRTKDDLEDFCYSTPDWKPEPAPAVETKTDDKPKQPKIFSFHRHRDTNNPTPRYLVKNLLPETGIGLLSGQSGTYKTFVGIKLAGAVSTGQPFAGHVIKRQGAALMFASEGAAELPIRLEALSEAEHGGKALPIFYSDDAVRLLDKTSVSTVIATAKAVADEAQRDYKLPLALILFDTIIAAAQFAKAGDENDAAVGAKLMAALGQISRATGTFVLGIDHFGKAVETGTRGTSAKEAAADIVLALLADKAISGEVAAPRLCIRKRRSGPAGVEHPFTIKVIPLGQDEDGEDVTSLVVNFSAAVPPPLDEDAAKWSPSLRLLRKIMMTLLATAGEQIMPFADGPSVLAVKADYVRAEFYKQHASDQSGTKRKAFDRAISRAQERDLVGVREVSGVKWLWLPKQQAAGQLRNERDSGTGQDTL